MATSHSGAPLLVGAHTIANGGIQMAVRRAAAAGMTTIQLFTAIPKYYSEKVGVKPERVARFQEALADAGIPARHCWCTPPTCSTPPPPIRRSGSGRRRARPRSSSARPRWASARLLPPRLGQGWRPRGRDGAGRAAPSPGRSMRARRARRAWWSRTPPARAARSAARPRRSAASWRRCRRMRGARAGYGLDTCHLFAFGHDIAASPQAQPRCSTRSSRRPASRRRSSTSTTAKVRSAPTAIGTC